MSDMISYNRDMYEINPDGCVELRVELAGESGGLRTYSWLQCKSCGDPMEWVPNKKYFECPSCGYELTAIEVSGLCLRHIAEVKSMYAMVGKRKGRLWRLLRWLGIGKRRRIASSV